MLALVIRPANSDARKWREKWGGRKRPRRVGRVHPGAVRAAIERDRHGRNPWNAPSACPLEEAVTMLSACSDAAASQNLWELIGTAYSEGETEDVINPRAPRFQ